MRVFLILCAVLLYAVPASSQTLKANFVGCLTEDALDEFITAAVNDDSRQMQALLGTVCVPVGGHEFSMVDQGFLVSEVRVYAGGDSVRLFVPAEATR